MGVMVESHIKEGRQDLKDEGLEKLTYGQVRCWALSLRHWLTVLQSITDACISFEDTVKVLNNFRKAVQARRAVKSGESAPKKART